MKLEIKDLTKFYNKKKCVLDNISFTLTEGIYGLVGPNGAGKSTLMNILSGLIVYTSGQIIYSENDFLSDEYYRNFGYLPQYNALYEHFTCHEFLDYICILKEVKNKDRIKDVLSMVNLLSRENEKIKNLSGGMKQRLSIAQILINDPKIILLDEPTAGLDPRERIRLKNILGKLSKDKIIIISTHIISDMENLADQIILLNEGKIITSNSPKKLKDSLKGSFYEIETKDLQKFKDYRKTLIQATDIGYKIRFISKQNLMYTPCENISLEDVYLYYYGDNYD